MVSSRGAAPVGTFLAQTFCMNRADIDVVVRCKNEMPFAAEALAALRGFRVLFIDDGSTDGSTEAAAAAGARIVAATDLSPGGYVPGRILNEAMRRTDGDLVAFVNADAIPRGDRAVEWLIEACQAGAAAAYGRQVARPDAPRAIHADHARAFPAAGGAVIAGFFSMAASAIRRDVWRAMPFDETLRYSEDVDWARRARGLGHRVVYVPGAVFEHSHTYGVPALFRRMRGEGAVDRYLAHDGPPPLLRHYAAPLLGALARDLRAGVLDQRTLALRAVAQAGRFAGRLTPAVARVVPERHAAGPASRNGTGALPASLEASLTRAASIIRHTLGEAVLAVVAVGSLGGSEPALTWEGERPRPRNDADLVAVVPSRMKARALRGAAARAGEEATRELGFPVDVAAIGREELETAHGRLLWVDVAIRGARVLAGDPAVLAPLASLGADVAPDEVRRLLVNRATGLALSRLDAAAGEHDPEQAARHVAKAWLAAGDAILFGARLSRATTAERAEALAALAAAAPWLAPTVDGYRRGAAWQAAPQAAPMDEATFEHERARLALALEQAAPAGTGRAGDASMIGRLLPTRLGDVGALGRVGAGALAIARGVVAPSVGALSHPRAALARASVRLAFGERLERELPAVARAIRAHSAAPDDVREALVRLREVAA
jgi:rhamnosyltransferase